MEIFNETKILLWINGMPDWRRIAFMTYCCERMFPNYVDFSKETEFGDASVLRNSLDYIWEWIEFGKLNEDAATLVKACEKQAPDTEDFTSIYTSAALDAAAATAITINATASPTAMHLIDVASLSRDTVDLFVQFQEDIDPNDPRLEGMVCGSQLMQNELRIQKESLEFLVNLEGGRETVTKVLRARWSNLDNGSLKLAQLG
ncbi:MULTISPECIES: DUF416 family protein [Xanthomonas]|uniref:DUF416 family protein n=1 Tax=Xanthomonas TaxID=338 RepID=UPI00094ABDE1|nr:DUF416 family protein [Xanthomonas campestris]MCC5043502.1 YjaG family protein [Xanthomonas campestris]MCD0252517.1 DUF416 family protein [Xanthomonas campestris pv. campestris]MCD0273707.1 DUF416 family protein [Xanthomonas campestris pv. campestris]MCF8789109.1 DUF416 family protein [Xanthomonas campestris pv. campestris]MCF8803171.1 DUF416 family protein [Xanthomonas campestris pv. campestris]